MRSNPAFDLFEEICAELGDQNEAVLTDVDFSAATLESVQRRFRETAANAAIAKALDYLCKHFEARGSLLPFNYDLLTGRVTVLNRNYIDFVSSAQEQRSIAKESKDFEAATSMHLASRLTGMVRRVGSPRKKHKSRKKFLVNEFKFRKGGSCWA